MIDALLWYVSVQIVGIAVLPLAVGLLARLPDRGYAFARPIGLLVVGYVLWLGATFGLLANQATTVVVVVVGVGAVTWLACRKGREQLADLWRRRSSVVVAAEIVFIAGFAVWGLVRATLPDITGTEKPMEIAFLNGILRSSGMPPVDPWLSGYSISYYYFGYLMTAALTRMAEVPSAVAFNLMIATLFGLASTGAFSLGYNLVAGDRERRIDNPWRGWPWIAGILAILLTLFVANWNGVLELLYVRGIGSPDFWQAVGINGLSNPYVSPTGFPTDRVDNWWWWRSTRVIGAYGANGDALDYTITEFPFFSFLLADLHPHVLALPFAFLALSWALSSLRGDPIDPAPFRDSALPNTWWGRAASLPIVGHAIRHVVLYPARWVRTEPVWAIATGLLFGGLGFLNAWDLPTYLAVLVCAVWLRSRATDDRRMATRDVVRFAISAVVLAVALYLPFYVGFRAQTRGIGVVEYRSQLHQFLIFWGPLLSIIGVFVVAQLIRSRAVSRDGRIVVWRLVETVKWRRIWAIVACVAVAFVVLRALPAGSQVTPWLQAPVLSLLLPLLTAAAMVGWRYLAGASAPDSVEEAQKRQAGVRAQRVATASTSGSSPVQVMPRHGRREETNKPAAPRIAPEHSLALLMASVAILLISGTEVAFIRDFFGNRMNTVFKLYYQSWVLMASAGAYAIYYLASVWGSALSAPLRRVGGAVAGIALVASLGAGLLYAPMALASRLSTASGQLTLNGAQYLSRAAPSEYEAIQWLQDNVQGTPVVVQADGSSYSQFDLVAAFTGLPTILGWDFHEVQWRGTDVVVTRREADLRTIYSSTDRAAIESLLRAYGVTYVYVGPNELTKYGRQARGNPDVFGSFMDVVYRQTGVTIYRMR